MVRNVVNDEIRDTTWKESSVSLANDNIHGMFHIVNKLDESVRVQIYGSSGGSDKLEHDVRLANLSVEPDYGEAVSFRNPWNKIKIRYKAGVAPTSGNLLITGMYGDT